jgi:hypothetical protein
LPHFPYAPWDDNLDDESIDHSDYDDDEELAYEILSNPMAFERLLVKAARIQRSRRRPFDAGG